MPVIAMRTRAVVAPFLTSMIFPLSTLRALSFIVALLDVVAVYLSMALRPVRAQSGCWPGRPAPTSQPPGTSATLRPRDLPELMELTTEDRDVGSVVLRRAGALVSPRLRGLGGERPAAG